MSDDSYFVNRDRLLSARGYTPSMLRAQIGLFCTWAAIHRYDDLEAAADHVADYEVWLVGQGFPERSAAIGARAIQRRLAALGLI